MEKTSETEESTLTSEDMKEYLDSSDFSTMSKKEIADHCTKVACRLLSVSNKYKEPLLEKWKNFEDLKAGRIKRKLRSQFNVALPVYSGLLDTLAADFDEPVELEFDKKHPSNYFKAKRIQGAWNLQKNSTDKDAKWDYKSRLDKSINILHGRSILKYYAHSNPKYHSVLEVVNPLDFHCQPDGGGQLENHLFAGQEGILRTVSELLNNTDYDLGQVRKLLTDSKSDEYSKGPTEYAAQKLQRFKAVGLDPQNNNYVGEATYNLCEFVITHKGIRWYILFDPWTETWLRFGKLKDIFSKNLFPWTSWATHEDDKVFWSQGYGDIFYSVADSIITLFNQELTNREKQNLNARAYDKDMFTDVAKLDAAQYRPDALVPVDTKGGTRAIASGIYSFTTPELSGTINLLDWINASVRRDTGVNDVSQGAAMDATKKVNVAFLEQASVAKRIGYKSQSYTECWGEIGTRFIQGLKDHMTDNMYIEVLGDSGIEPDVMTREDLEFEGDLGVKVVSSTYRKQEANNNKKARIEALKLLMQSQNINSEMRDAAILRDVGNYSEEEIKLFLDTKNYAAKESVAKAHIAIQELIAGEKPELNYAADSVFLKIIFDYMMDHRNKLGIAKGKKFTMYLADHAGIATQNAQNKGAATGQKNQRMEQMKAGAGKGAPVKSPIAPAPAPAPEQAQVM